MFIYVLFLGHRKIFEIIYLRNNGHTVQYAVQRFRNVWHTVKQEKLEEKRAPKGSGESSCHLRGVRKDI